MELEPFTKADANKLLVILNKKRLELLEEIVNKFIKFLQIEIVEGLDKHLESVSIIIGRTIVHGLHFNRNTIILDNGMKLSANLPYDLLINACADATKELIKFEMYIEKIKYTGDWQNNECNCMSCHSFRESDDIKMIIKLSQNVDI